MADDEIIMVQGCKSRAACSVLLRGPNDYMLDEMDRSLHDALCIVKRVLESGKVVAGVALHLCIVQLSFAFYEGRVWSCTTGQTPKLSSSSTCRLAEHTAHACVWIGCACCAATGTGGSIARWLC